ncbi:MAG: AbrB/MazE/SpoVT family DNA-binding domain-containing protein [Phycisphaerae bacterium]
MQKQLTRIGSSLGIIIDKAILDLLKITADTPLDITTDGDRLILRPVRHVDDEAARSLYKEIAAEHRESFRKLTE